MATVHEAWVTPAASSRSPGDACLHACLLPGIPEALGLFQALVPSTAEPPSPLHPQPVHGMGTPGPGAFLGEGPGHAASGWSRPLRKGRETRGREEDRGGGGTQLAEWRPEPQLSPPHVLQKFRAVPLPEAAPHPTSPPPRSHRPIVFSCPQ